MFNIKREMRWINLNMTQSPDRKTHVNSRLISTSPWTNITKFIQAFNKLFHVNLIYKHVSFSQFYVQEISKLQWKFTISKQLHDEKVNYYIIKPPQEPAYLSTPDFSTFTIIKLIENFQFWFQVRPTKRNITLEEVLRR